MLRSNIRGGHRTEKIGSAPRTSAPQKTGSAPRTSAPETGAEVLPHLRTGNFFRKPVFVDYNATHWTRKMYDPSNR